MRLRYQTTGNADQGVLPEITRTRECEPATRVDLHEDQVGNLAFLSERLSRIAAASRYALTSKRASVYVVAAILALGALARVSAFLGDRTLFVDEAALARNVITRSFSGLTKPLDLAQGAPLGYLMAVKVFVLAGGNNEYALRAWSVLMALGSLVMFGALARRSLGAAESIVACALFAFCPSLVYFAAEGKPYSTDVFVATLLLYAAVRADEAMTGRRVLALGIVGVIVTWFSHPSVFLLAAVGALLAIKALRTGQFRAVVGIATAGFTWLASVGLLYVLSLRGLAHNEYLLNYWKVSFMPLSIGAAVKWLWYSGWEMTTDPFGGNGDPTGHLIGWLFAIGILTLCATGNKRGLGWLIVGPLLLTLLASAARLYPFGGYGGRLLLFAIPAIILGATTGWSVVCSGRGWALPLTLTVAILVPAARLTIQQARGDVRSIRGPEELRPLLQRMNQEVRPGDHVYVFKGASVTFSLYAHEFGYLSGRDLYVQDGRVSFLEEKVSPPDYEIDLQPLRGAGRVWVVFSHGFSRRLTDEEALLTAARRYGTELSSSQSPGAGVYLFDFAQGDVRAR